MMRFLLFTLLALPGCANRATNGSIESNATTHYKNLGDFELNYDSRISIDLDNDGVKDIAFATTTFSDYFMHKTQFIAYTRKRVFILQDNSGASIVGKGDSVRPLRNRQNTWDGGAALIATRQYAADPATANWQGPLKESGEKYLGIKLRIKEQDYLGWIRLSSGGKQAKIIIHDCAVSRVPAQEIAAGEMSGLKSDQAKL